MFKEWKLKKQFEEESWSARVQMETKAQRDVENRLKAVEIRFRNETDRHRGQEREHSS